MPKKYPLEIENWGEDTYIVGSRGHHDKEQFMLAVRSAGYDWPMGNPTHEWLKAVPNSAGTVFAQATPETRGAFPATVSYEAYGDELYRAPGASSD